MNSKPSVTRSPSGDPADAAPSGRDSLTADPSALTELAEEVRRQGDETRRVLLEAVQCLADRADVAALHVPSMALTQSSADWMRLRELEHSQRKALGQVRWQAAIERATQYNRRRYFAPRARIAQLERFLERGLLKFGTSGEVRFLARQSILSEAAASAQVAGGVSLPGIRRTDSPAQYVTRGRDPAAAPPTLFDQTYYLSEYPDVTDGRYSALSHYILHGEQEGRLPHPLFDPSFYRDQLGTVATRLRCSLLAHYVSVGGLFGLDPHRLFSGEHYITQTDDVAGKGVSPLVHYLSEGWRRGLDPHPLFRNDWYLQQNPDVAQRGIAPLLHYVIRGGLEGRRPHPLFDPLYYVRRYPDAANSRMNPLEHYLSRPAEEARQPSSEFDAAYYLDVNEDVRVAGINPLVHYVTNGFAERRPVHPGFHEEVLQSSLGGNVDLRLTGLELWIEAGQPEASVAINRSVERPSPAIGGATASSITGAHALFTSLANAARETDDNYDYFGYQSLSEHLSRAERERIQGLKLRPVDIITLGTSELPDIAKSLRFEMPANPKISIIIPVYNNLKYTVEALVSLHRAGGLADCEILVMDDGSTDSSATLLSLVKGLRYERNAENLGFIRNCNRGAELARGDIVTFLNNDVQVSKGWLQALVAPLGDPGVGATAPMLLFPNGRLQEAGARINTDGTAQLIGLFDDPDLPRYNYDRDVDYASGACLTLRREDFLRLGGFDQQFVPAYCEDADLCFRLQAEGLRIRYVAKARVVHHLSVTSRLMGDDFKARQAIRNQQKFVERWGNRLEEQNRVKTIAFYLPQFHAIPENDRWWGPGFTEWTNVTRALPNFAGHYQPHRPGELGYYDLTHPDILSRQAQLAQRYGVDGFCFYYYSFNGRRVLEKPVESVLARPDWTFPFCVCWANENWTRTWDGQDREVLLSQEYDPASLDGLINDIIRHMRHPAYIRVDGRPLFVVYRPGLIPYVKTVAERWRRRCRETGVGEIYLAFAETFENARAYLNPAEIGFDASIEFPPSGMDKRSAAPGQILNPKFAGATADYHRLVLAYAEEPVPGHVRFLGAMPSWDNTARRQDVSLSFPNASPGAFQAWLEWLFSETRSQNASAERMIFINAWNEWAEGAHLEPDQRFGRAWLEAVRNAHDGPDLLISRN